MDRTRLRAKALGIEAELGRPFPCVLPGHADSATLYPTGAHWRYRCGEWTAGLAEVRASLAYGRPLRVGDQPERSRLGSTVVARWAERLDHDAGLLQARPVPHELPGELSPAGLAVARGVLLLLALRDERWAGQAFTFTRDFAKAYCGLGERTARDGIAELRHTGFLIFDGKQRQAYLWRVAGEDEEAP